MRIPQLGVSPLLKALIQIRGPDATKFLNGLITLRLLPNIVKKKQHTISAKEDKHAKLDEVIDLNKNWGLMHEDIYDPEENILIRRDGINSMFLNSKGRIVNDCFLYSQPFHNHEGKFDEEMLEPNFLVEIDQGFVSQLQMLLRLHKLSSRIKITHRKDLHSYYYYNDSVEFDEWLDDLQFNHFNSFDPIDALQKTNSFIRQEVLFNSKYASNIVGFAIDNRIPNFGIKIITNKELVVDDKADDAKIPLNEVFSQNFLAKFPIECTSEEYVTKRRYINGLFEIADAPKGTSLLPFETNLDYVNGLSLEKGCYVGQELTIRTFNNGIIRKRIVPIQFFEINDTNMETMAQQDYPILDREDPIIDLLKNINSSTISNIDVSALSHDQNSSDDPEPQTAAANNPFGSKPIASSGPSPFGSTSKPVRKRKTSKGKILSSVDNLGFMLMNTSDLHANTLYEMGIPSLQGGSEQGVKKVGIKAYQPDWWLEEEPE
ncbi:Aminomethyltransferase folate-binding domain-containing protein [Hyphopichia burtonii NRRL Y-1933]|uniref:Aminomethyltransferase folate-binding domain-containing protein n=1 Tax=Hyphopichia burtonii NRRL Y-1933 TaxID=984485 RepID=A0A1E4RHQ5_9ASCO|nr:Aminomethyltransferase folate-binding domain-containing protein [Hyphopichia burtonii NRRL Y-1933]ODV66751.1 Aminomethyltransferase folate-binding domain-containing protein [Hyphopichia burtonii NRRL Y-1933]